MPLRGLRLSDDLKTRLEGVQKLRADRSVNAFILEAVEEKRQRTDAESVSESEARIAAAAAALGMVERTKDRQRVLAAHGALLFDERLPLIVTDFRRLRVNSFARRSSSPQKAGRSFR